MWMKRPTRMFSSTVMPEKMCVPWKVRATPSRDGVHRPGP
jgi:hypothetical protein